MFVKLLLLRKLGIRFRGKSVCADNPVGWQSFMHQRLEGE